MNMKQNIIFCILAAIFVFNIQTANAQENGQEKIKAEKERQKLAEKQEKERLKKPPQIEINAPSKGIGELLVNVFKARNYKVDVSSKTKIGMSLIMPQVNNQTPTGGMASYKIVISLDEKDGKTKVTINPAMIAPDGFGRTQYISLDRDKKTRAEIEAILAAVKEKIEGN